MDSLHNQSFPSQPQLKLLYPLQYMGCTFCFHGPHQYQDLDLALCQVLFIRSYHFNLLPLQWILCITFSLGFHRCFRNFLLISTHFFQHILFHCVSSHQYVLHLVGRDFHRSCHIYTQNSGLYVLHPLVLSVPPRTLNAMHTVVPKLHVSRPHVLRHRFPSFHP